LPLPDTFSVVTGEPVVVEFRPDDPGRVLAHMDTASSRRHGWVNLQPVPVHEEEAATTTSLFSGPSPPKLPLCTWKVEERRGRVETTLGIQHGVGMRIAPHLRQAGVTAAPEWRVLQDHRRRGLVVSVPQDTEAAVILDWLLRAGEKLALVETTGIWAAELYDR
jgi:hypothetical protein